MTAKYRYIGRHTPRKDARDIVTGAARFIDDIRMPNMLYGKALRCPLPHARIERIDTRRARDLPGVRAVLTFENVPDWKTGMPKQQPVLDRHLRFAGDAAALVAADTEAIARAATDLIEVSYEVLAPVYDVAAAVAPEAPRLHAAFANNTVPPFPAFGPKTINTVVTGDVAAGFASADIIREGTFSYENIANPLPIEPPGVIAHWEDTDRLTVWSGTQSASWHRFIMQSKMGFPDIRAINTHCGGSFGSKNYAPLPLFYAAALARATHRPVKFGFTKEEHFGAFVLRLGSRFQGKIGMQKDGTITAVAGDWIVDTGAYSDMTQAQIAVACGEAQLILRCANWDLKTRLVCTNRCPSGVIRGFGGQELVSALAPLLDELMAAAGLDPVIFFKKNYVKPGDDYTWREGGHWVCRGRDYRQAMERGAQAFGWHEKWKGWLQPTATDGPRRIGVGVGIHGNADVGEDETEAYVRLNPDASAVIHVLVGESGMGQRSSICKMVAEVLQIPLEKVHMTPADTMVNPYEFGLVGSRGTYAVGSAVIQAVREAKQKLFQRAAALLDCDADSLSTVDGRVFVASAPDHAVSWNKVIGLMQTCTGFGRFVWDFSMPNFFMIFAEVAVDTETGRIDILRMLGASDVGQIIDPRSIEGQIHGALGSAGTDSAIFEESVLDRSTGRLLNMNMIDYKWRTFLELPDFEHELQETPFDSPSFGAIGISEITTTPGPGAVLMAVSNAIGRHLHDYPLTPDVVLKALGTIKGGRNA